jgi:hypothetical protein
MLEFLLIEYKINVLTFRLQKNGVKGVKFGVNTFVWGLGFVVWCLALNFRIDSKL